MDRETESGGESTHIYSKELKTKLMSVFTRTLDGPSDDVKLADDVQYILSHPGKFATAMFNAHSTKMKLFDRKKDDSEQTLLQLLIQEANVQKVRTFFKIIAADLDDRLNAS